MWWQIVKDAIALAALSVTIYCGLLLAYGLS